MKPPAVHAKKTDVPKPAVEDTKWRRKLALMPPAIHILDRLTPSKKKQAETTKVIQENVQKKQTELVKVIQANVPQKVQVAEVFDDNDDELLQNEIKMLNYCILEPHQRPSTGAFKEIFLGDITASSAFRQFAIGGIVGCISAYVSNEFGNMAAASVGGKLFLIQIAQQNGYIKLDWARVTHGLTQAEARVNSQMMKHKQSVFDKVMRFYEENFFMATGFATGLSRQYRSRHIMSLSCGKRVDVCDKRVDVCDKRVDVCDKIVDVCGKRVDVCDKRVDVCDKRVDVCDKIVDVCGKRVDVCDKRGDVCDKRVQWRFENPLAD